GHVVGSNALETLRKTQLVAFAFTIASLDCRSSLRGAGGVEHYWDVGFDGNTRQIKRLDSLE
ncbi:hypothetical protein OFP00_31130, partial [Escherichia coli]|nr:hypothetical protein [Escherichia coli]